jgi:hypothetical protein
VSAKKGAKEFADIKKFSNRSDVRKNILNNENFSDFSFSIRYCAGECQSDIGIFTAT